MGCLVQFFLVILLVVVTVAAKLDSTEREREQEQAPTSEKSCEDEEVELYLLRILAAFLGLTSAVALGLMLFFNYHLIAAKAKLLFQRKNPLADPQVHYLSLAFVKQITDNFSESRAIGQGGFGKVYRGVYRNQEGGEITVAVKRAVIMSEGRARVRDQKKRTEEFQREVGIVSKLRHRNVLPLIGYCDEEGELIVVYEFLANGNLKEHLDGSRGPHIMNWETRLRLALDIAKGVEYIHNSSSDEPIMHRDLKPTNILIDQNMRAKIADFGTIREERDIPNPSDGIAGTIGYRGADAAFLPTLKVDVYGFGVILWQLITGRPALEPNLSSPDRLLVRSCEEKSLGEIVDPNIGLNENDEDYKKIYCMYILAKCCTYKKPEARPNMTQVMTLISVLVEATPPFEREGEPDPYDIENRNALAAAYQSYLESAEPDFGTTGASSQPSTPPYDLNAPSTSQSTPPSNSIV